MLSDDGHLLIAQGDIEQMLVDFAGAYDPLALQLFFSIRSLARRINDAASEWLAPFGLTATQYNYLAALYANRETGMSPTELAASVHTASGSVASMLNGLEREKLIKRHQHESDRRSAIVRLSARGERLFHEAASLHHRRIMALVSQVGKREAQQLLDGIVSLGSALQNERARA